MSDIAFVTGASGFVGSAVARQLAAKGFGLRLAVRASSRLDNVQGLGAEIVTVDMKDRDGLSKAMQGARYLFHVAADYRLWARDPEDIVRNNLEGTRAVMQAAKAAGIERIVYTSSVATLKARTDGVAVDETCRHTVESAIGAYKRSKVVAERLVEQMVGEGLPAVIVSPSTPIGPRDIKPTPTGKMILEAAAGRMPAYLDTGLNVVHVDDVATGHLLALEKGRIGERYILGGENLPLGDLLRLIAEITGKRPPSLKLPNAALWPVALGMEAAARAFGIEPLVTRDHLRMARKKMFYSSAKAQTELGYTPRPARQAVADAVAWFRANRMLKS